MMKNMRRGIPNLFKEGTKLRTGLQESIIRNLEACKSLADMTKTSLGPNGMNKMVVNHLGKLFVTSDTAVLLKEMEVAHPAAKLLVMAANMQEAEIGDGSNFVICFAGELLSQAQELIEMGLNTNEIITGYSRAFKKSLEFIDTLVVESISNKSLLDKSSVTRAILGPIASKQYGVESFLAPLVAEACLTVMPSNTANFNVDNVRVVKILGGTLQWSEVVRGMVIPHDTVGSTKKAIDAKVVIYTASIGLQEPETKGTILIQNANELMNYNTSEEKQLETIIKGIASAGVKMVITGSSVDDLAEHFLEKYGLMCLKISSKFELRRVAKATRARALPTMVIPSADDLGFCSSIYVREVGSQKVTVFSQVEGDRSAISTILLRASTHNVLNDLERAIDDGVNTVKALSRDGRLLAGAGACEIELARLLAQYASKQPGLEQYALNKFATALEVIPRQLAENAGLDTMDILSQLYAAHEKGHTNVGVDVEGRGVADMTKQSSILDLLLLKQQAIKLAVDAALTVLRVDSIIQAKPAGGPKVGGNRDGHWDDTD